MSFVSNWQGISGAPKYVLNYVGKGYGIKPTQEPDVKVVDIFVVNMYLLCEVLGFLF